MAQHGMFTWLSWLLCVIACIMQGAGGFQLTLMHTNDIHGRIEETNKASSRCSAFSVAKGKCYGGMERLKTKVKELRAKYPNSLLLDAGDPYQGSLLFYVYGGVIMSHFMNVLGYDAMALGNHEFDRGPEGLEPFLDNVTFPVLSCNIDTSKAPQVSSVQKSVILNVAGQKIGVVGYTTPDTPSQSSPGPVTFSDEIKAMQTEVDKLTKQGVNKIIGLGHSGYARDLEIAKGVRDLDLIIGGHSHSFLYNGEAPDREEPLGLYPTVVKNVNGKRVLVVQDYAYGKYLGFLQVDFDDKGVATAWSGNPILMDNSVPKDPEVTALIEAYLSGVMTKKTEKIGESFVHLQGDRIVCRVRECNMGNLIADAIIHQNLRPTNSQDWNDVAIALYTGGGIRASISKGDIMLTDVLDVMPFQYTIDLITITGRVLWEALEHSASRRVDKGDLFSGFLQVSGLRVVYDMRQKVGQRVKSAHALCADCEIPEFHPLDMDKYYRVMSTSFTVGGGDGFTMLRDGAKSHTIGARDNQVLFDYIKNKGPVIKGLDNRIQFLQDEDTQHNCPDAAITNQSSILLLLITSIVSITLLFV